MSLIDKASLIQIPSGYKSTKLYSIEPTNGDGDFTFSRSSSGTRVNSEGLIETASVLGSELVVNGDFATDSDWSSTEVATIRISGGSINFSSTSSNKRIQNIGSIIVGKKYIVNYDIVSISEGSFAFQDGVSTYTYRSSTGSYSEEITASGTFIRIRTAGTTTGSIDNVSVKEVIENDVPRLDYSGGASCASLLLEGQSTNLFAYSEDFINSYWAKSSQGSGIAAIVTANYATSPDGTQNATRVQFDAVGTTSSDRSGLVRNFAFTSGQTYSISCWVKSTDGTNQVIQFRVAGAQVPEEQIATSEWQLYTATFTATATTTDNFGMQIRGINSVNESDILIYGMQLELSDYPTSYIPTSGSTVTRTADVCNNAGTSATFNDNEGVLMFEASRLNKADNSSVIWSISDGSNSNAVSLYYYASGIGVDIFNTLGTKSLLYTMTLTKQATLNKLAIKYKSNDIALWVNGSEVATNTDAISLSGLNQLMASYGSGSFPFYGKTKQLMVFNEALSDEELSDLTGQINLSFNNLATFYGYTIL